MLRPYIIEFKETPKGPLKSEVIYAESKEGAKSEFVEERPGIEPVRITRTTDQH